MQRLCEVEGAGGAGGVNGLWVGLIPWQGGRKERREKQDPLEVFETEAPEPKADWGQRLSGQHIGNSHTVGRETRVLCSLGNSHTIGRESRVLCS